METGEWKMGHGISACSEITKKGVALGATPESCPVDDFRRTKPVIRSEDVLDGELQNAFPALVVRNTEVRVGVQNAVGVVERQVRIGRTA